MGGSLEVWTGFFWHGRLLPCILEVSPWTVTNKYRYEKHKGFDIYIEAAKEKREE